VRTSDGIVPVRIAKFEISYSEGGGQFYFYAIGEPVNGLLKMPSQHVVAATDLPDCNRSCALSTTKPSEDKAQKIRALAVEKLRVTFPEDIPEKERAETLVVYEGHFTRVDGTQYVAFFSRHHKDAMDQGKWATYVANSDFSLISVLGRDDYLNVMPDGVADVNGDGLDEIWSDDVGFEGTAYSLWYLNKTDPISFARIEWEYFGL
jgi:hypothetical protein